MAAQLLPHFNPPEPITPSLLHHFNPSLGSPAVTSFYPLWLIYALTLTPFYPHPPYSLGSPAVTSFYPLWTIYPLTLTTFYPPWQPSSYLILTPLNQLHPHYYTILPPSLDSPAVTSFYTLWTTDPLALTPFYPRWKPNAVQKDVRVLSCNFLKKFLPLQPHPYIILPPSEKIPPQSYTILPPGQLNSYIILTPLNKLPPHSYIILTPFPALTSFYPLWTIYALTLNLTPFYPPPPLLCWQPSYNLILHPLNNLPTHSYTNLPPLES